MKPSPVPSILLFIGTAILLFSLLGRGWYSVDNDSVQMSSGPLWSKVCFDAGDGMNCETSTVFSDLGKGGMNGFRILGLLFVLTALAGTIMAGIAGILLLGKQRTALALVTVITLGVATLCTLGTFFYVMSKGVKDLPGYGWFLFFIGTTLALVGSIMAMRRGGPAPRPGGHAYPPQAGQYGYGQPGHPPGGVPGYPPNAPGYPAQPPAYAPPQQAPYAQPVAAPAGAPEGAAPQQAGPGHTCGASMTWVAQYNRWFCPRCNQYG